MESKPIFIIKTSKDTSPQVIAELRNDIAEKNPELLEQYHVFVIQGNSTVITFECFNSPYKPEEFTKLTDLIEKLNKENGIKEN